MKKKRFLILFLCAILCFSICGCKKSSSEENKSVPESEEELAESISLIYCANDTYDPYTLISKSNAELCQLLYDPLYKLNDSFEPIAVLAEKAEREANNWKITLKDVCFTDNSKLTAEDVVFSFNLAKECPRYKTALSKINSLKASGKELLFELNISEPLFINLLTFPIIKSGSNALYNEDKVLLPPIGTGRYFLNETQTALKKNENYFGEKGNPEIIYLKNAPDSESISHYVEVGAADIFYADTSEGSIIRMDGKKVNINRNVLVYLGINDNDSLLSNINMRYAISSALSREKIVKTAFFGNAVAATGPFHPALKAVADYQTSPIYDNKEISIENLEKIGYNEVNGNGYRVNSSQNELRLSLLVNNENAQRVSAAELIGSALKEIGIRVNLVKLPYNEYLKALENGSFQLYLGEVKIDADFDISELVLPGGSCAFGKVESENAAVSMQSVIDEYRNGSAELTNIITAVQSQMPFIPVCFRSGIVFYNENLQDNLAFCENDLFLSIGNLAFKD